MSKCGKGGGMVHQCGYVKLQNIIIKSGNMGKGAEGNLLKNEFI